MGKNFFINCANIKVPNRRRLNMDVQKIGELLATLRKEQKLTQEELGEKIGVTNKTVSRWENGNYMPPVEILLILSKQFNVSINELLSGERLSSEQYKENAEEYIVDNLIKTSKEAKKRLTLSFIIACITIFAGITIIILGSIFAEPIWLKIVSIVISLIIVILGIGVCCVLTFDAGVYKCPNCGEKFVPTLKDFIFGLHTFTKRKLKCPKCGKKSYCKKLLS